LKLCCLILGQTKSIEADRGGIIGFYLWHWHLQLYLFFVLVIVGLLVEAASKGIAPSWDVRFFIGISLTLYLSLCSQDGFLPKSGGWLNTVKVVLDF
jgi:hypothetical protein